MAPSRLQAGGILMNDIIYRYGNDLNLDQVIELCRASTLGERRPVDNRRIMADMLNHANLVVTAWDSELLVGIARTLTDFSYVGYLADLAVRDSYQRQGIGVQLIEKTRDRPGPRSMLVLLAAPKAVDYYPKIGFTRHGSAWTLHAADKFAAR
jgi:GNAT superfamily N-acetyltransferase